MARYPGAIWKPIDAKYLPGRKLVTHNRVNLHVAVSEASSLHGYFNGPGKPSSHMYLRKDGVFEQYVDTDYMAEADLEGNDATISVETQGGVKNANGEPWTDAQVEALAEFYAWCVKTHGVSLRMATSSKLGDESRGLSWHRLGIDGNFPDLPDIRAGRLQRGGGMYYSRSRGKICPGDAKIKQVPAVFSRAAIILEGEVSGGGNSKPDVKPDPKPEPKPTGIDEDGYWGGDTTEALQRSQGTPVDRKVSRQSNFWKTANPGLTSGWEWVASAKALGSQLIASMQREMGIEDDGRIGPDTINALSKRYGIKGDGHLDGPSMTIKAMQRRLNATGKF
ncbi:peptidoglycan recognition protein family protein [Demequina globuliformis]|uniref:peptidoglycan recognition protein family protein n=1 Tax=Demequina globuliformis TaxID=676202 RepID=UPI000781280E|nr:N-acetylmuramoyl-L-alanine amidase [Demequina globuliformis]